MSNSRFKKDDESSKVLTLPARRYCFQMLRIATLFATGIFATSIAFAQEEPPPPVEGWQLTARGTTSSEDTVEILTVETNYVPGFYNFSGIGNTFRKVMEHDLGNSNPLPPTSPVWMAELNVLEDTIGQVSYSGTLQIGTSHSAFIICAVRTQGAASEEFKYLPYPYNRFRTLEYRQVSTTYTVTYLP